MKKILILLAGIIFLAGCNENNDIKAEDLMHHRFNLSSVNGEEVQFTPAPFIEFSEKMYVNGQMCNTFFGSSVLENGKLTADGMASTEMLCSDNKLNELDNIIGQLLNAGATITLKDNVLTLKSPENELVYQLRDLVN